MRSLKIIASMGAAGFLADSWPEFFGVWFLFIVISGVFD